MRGGAVTWGAARGAAGDTGSGAQCLPLHACTTCRTSHPSPRLVEPVAAEHDLDNLRLEELGEAPAAEATFELEALMLTGTCLDLASLAARIREQARLGKGQGRACGRQGGAARPPATAAPTAALPLCAAAAPPVGPPAWCAAGAGGAGGARRGAPAGGHSGHEQPGILPAQVAARPLAPAPGAGCAAAVGPGGRTGLRRLATAAARAPAPALCSRWCACWCAPTCRPLPGPLHDCLLHRCLLQRPKGRGGGGGRRRSPGAGGGAAPAQRVPPCLPPCLPACPASQPAPACLPVLNPPHRCLWPSQASQASTCTCSCARMPSG